MSKTTYVKSAISVPFASLYLDLNNPRLGLENPPGYEDPRLLFNDAQQAELTKRIVDGEHDVESLIDAIIAHGWMSIDSIVVWEHPKAAGKYLVLEGNRRTTAVRQIRDVYLPRERKKLETSKKSKKSISKADLESQEKKVAQLEEIIGATKKLAVVPIHAATVEELVFKLPRVLAVRHITHTRPWGSYERDLWLLERYRQLFEDTFGEADLRWEETIVKRIAEDASLTAAKTRSLLLACSIYSRFRRNWEAQLPEGEAFAPSDYYLFELIVRSPWLRGQFGISMDAMHMPEDRETALFRWTFRLKRPGGDADKNENIFYRHENVREWAAMNKYDGQPENKTSFAASFDLDHPETAPTFRSVEEKWKQHQAQRAPTELLEDLVERFRKLPLETVQDQADKLEPLVNVIMEQAQTCKDVIEAQRKRAKTRK
jgi:hypothetical protein